MKNFLFSLLGIVLSFSLNAQQGTTTTKNDALKMREIYDAALTKGKAYSWLDHLSNAIGGRLSGSLNAQKAVKYTQSQLEELGLDKVWLQPVMVPKWTRGTREYAYIQTGPGSSTQVNIAALGGSIATPTGGLKRQVIEVKGIDELESYKDEIEGKIVFYNRPMDPTHIETFKAYGGCVDQRYSGAEAAAKYGAAAVIVRSLSLKIDEHPHTGSMSYGNLPNSKRIPAAAISTKDADYLSGILKLKKDLEFYLKLSSENHGEVESYNVIGQITGSEFPEEIMLVGGHLDSWDLGDGAHDDGAGVVQSMEVLRLLKEIDYKPKRTLRVVLFMNEENGLRGGKKYAEAAKNKNENHIFALESDAGGFTPRGFSFEAGEVQFAKIQGWKTLFKPYLIHYFEQGGSGADIGPLKDKNIVLAGLAPDSQRYFDIHHAATDTFDQINKRELELGAATMTSLIYLIDKYGL